MIAELQNQALQTWLDRLEHSHDSSTFPPDRRRSLSRSGERGTTAVPIAAASWQRFRAICDREAFQPWQAITSLVQVLLHRYTLADNIDIGVEKAGEIIAAQAAICTSATVRANCLEAGKASQDTGVRCPVDQLDALLSQKSVPPEQSPFRVLLSFVDDSAERASTGKCGPAFRGSCDFALIVDAREENSVLRATFDIDLYNAQTAERILKQVAFLIESFDILLDRPVDRIPLCFAAEARSIISATAAEGKSFAGSDLLHRRFEDQVRRFPNAVAVNMPGDPSLTLTYFQLNQRANCLARYLRQHGVGPDVLVGLFLDRTPNLIVAMLAILKAGGAYLPIDLTYPPERVAFMLSDAESPIVISEARTARALPQTNALLIRIDEDEPQWSQISADNLEPIGTAANLAYSIFTSGSTGRPKGVLITHANVTRLFDATEEWFHFNENDTWTFFHSSAFDFSVWEIWGALLYGGRLVVVPFVDSRSPQQFYELLSGQKVTVLNQTPSAFRQLIGVDERRTGQKLDQLRLVIFGGEALNLQSLAPWFGKYGDVTPRLINMYGITETTVHVTYRPLTVSDLTDAPGSVIGNPIPDLQLYILDPELQPVPVGVPGEVFVGGAGVARGYLKRDTLTAERFIANPFSCQGDGRLYRSGDLARRLSNGDIEYLGRADHQVKIRGFRIELGEVQAALTRHQSVREALVMSTKSDTGDDVLVAYVVPANSEKPAVDTLRHDLKSILPTYMVPSHFIFLQQLPLTSNGKIDRAALPAISTQRSHMEQVFDAPHSDMEVGIAEIYKQVLNVDSVGVDDDFFDLGGNSLRLAEAHSRLQELIGQNFSVADLFVHTTVRKLATSLNQAQSQKGLGQDLMSRAQRQRAAMSASRNRGR